MITIDNWQVRRQLKCRVPRRRQVRVNPLTFPNPRVNRRVTGGKDFPALRPSPSFPHLSPVLLRIPPFRAHQVVWGSHPRGNPHLHSHTMLEKKQKRTGIDSDARDPSLSTNPVVVGEGWKSFRILIFDWLRDSDGKYTRKRDWKDGIFFLYFKFRIFPHPEPTQTLKDEKWYRELREKIKWDFRFYLLI